MYKVKDVETDVMQPFLYHFPPKSTISLLGNNKEKSPGFGCSFPFLCLSPRRSLESLFKRAGRDWSHSIAGKELTLHMANPSAIPCIPCGNHMLGMA